MIKGTWEKEWIECKERFEPKDLTKPNAESQQVGGGFCCLFQ